MFFAITSSCQEKRSHELNEIGRCFMFRYDLDVLYIVRDVLHVTVQYCVFCHEFQTRFKIQNLLNSNINTTHFSLLHQSLPATAIHTS